MSGNQPADGGPQQRADSGCSAVPQPVPGQRTHPQLKAKRAQRQDRKETSEHQRCTADEAEND